MRTTRTRSRKQIPEAKPVAASLSTNGEKSRASTSVRIPPPKYEQIVCHVRGTAQYVSNNMGISTVEEMEERIQTDQTLTKKPRKGRDFDKQCRESMHMSAEGWAGIPTNAFREALIEACRTVGFPKTDARKALIAVQPHGISVQGKPILKIKGTSEKLISPVTTQGKPNIASRAQWKEWEVYDLTIVFDGGIFKMEDVVNLLRRAGAQVGVGAGRPASKTSGGMGWGTFEIVPPIDHRARE